MKILKIIILFTSLILVYQQKGCNQKILEYYGLKGIQHPIDYSNVIDETGVDFCPGTKSTCCDVSDFVKTRDLWIVKNKNIKGYLNKWLQIVQKIIAMQSFLIKIATRSQQKQSEYCKHFSYSFLNEKANLQKVFFFLSTSLQAYAEIQKGFYCSICDHEHNKYFGVERDGKLVNIMSSNFCTNLINFFSEFIYYKVNLIDPMVINTNFLMNCYYNTDKFQLSINYDVTLGKINNCIASGGTTSDCIDLCQEFKVGEVSEMFIGKIEVYENFMQNLENMITQFDSQNEDNQNLVIDYADKFEGSFFKTMNSFDDNQNSSGNLGAISIEVSGLGFDLLHKATDSPYGYNGEMERIYINKENEKDNEDHTNLNASVTPQVFNDPLEKQKFEEGHKAQKLEEIEEKPDEVTVENSDKFVEAKEEEFLKDLEQDGTVEGQILGNGDLGEGSEYKEKYVGILRTLGILIFTIQ